jgi:hypothetical protein
MKRLTLLEVVFCLPFWGLPVAVLAQEASQQVDNETRTLIPVNVSSNNGSATLSVLNTSTKVVRAFTIQILDESITAEFFPPLADGIAPASEYPFTFSLPSQQPRSAHGIELLPRISLIAAWFADGSSEGDSAAVADIKAGRRGTIAQLRRIIPLYESIGTASDEQLIKTISSVADKVAILPETPDNDDHPPLMTVNGFRAVRSQALSDLAPFVHPHEGANSRDVRAYIQARTKALTLELDALAQEQRTAQ